LLVSGRQAAAFNESFRSEKVIKKPWSSLLIATLALPAAALAKKEAKLAEQSNAASASSFKKETDKISYGIGLDMGKNFRRMQVEIDAEQVLRGLQDGYAGKPQQIPTEELGEIMSNFQKSLKDKQVAAMKRIGEENQKAEAVFLTENAKKEGVVTLPSGLQYKILQKGSGAIPTDDSWVESNYRGKLLDGTEFDSSYRAGKPALFKVGDATPGWREALKLMPAGSKWQLFVPSKLGYGERGAGREIMPYATLIFEVELLNANAGMGVPSAPGK